MITLKSLGLAEANVLMQAEIARADEIGSPSRISVLEVGGTIVGLVNTAAS
jgi:hypothetical protein